MSKDLQKKAVEMLLKGATLVSDPCPYCKGVRIIKDGNALCVNCGKEGTEKKVESESEGKEELGTMDKLDQKIKELTEDLQKEKDLSKQKQILGSLSEIIAIKEKLRNL